MHRLNDRRVLRTAIAGGLAWALLLLALLALPLAVSSAEADPLNGYLSQVSPLGKQLMGRHVGEQVEVASPDGTVVFRITEIR